MRPFALLVPFLFVSTAQACINDRDSDSLALQAKKLPETLRVITGRFERNPPLYNEMRIRRSLASLKENPHQFGLYDDIAAAYDRLHQVNDAVRVMEKKRLLLPPYNAKNPTLKEAWYRYFANSGTFRAHQWLGAGAHKETLGEMKKARSYIARAIAIKPNSHFGREKYQLMTMDWIIATREKPLNQVSTLGDWISSKEGWNSGAGSEENKMKAVEGMSGLIVLGAAWQSPDTFQALAKALESRNGIALGYLAMKRCQEILKSGKASLNPNALNMEFAEDMMRNPWYGEMSGVAVNKVNQDTLDELYPRLRTDADIWQGHRTAFMLAKMEQGSHPDTNPTFWQGWKPQAPPSVDVAWYNQKMKRYNDGSSLAPPVRPYVNALLIVLGSCALGCGLLRVASRRRLS